MAPSGRSCLASARIIAIVCSATAGVLEPGARVTRMPRAAAAARSTSSTPTPWRAITRKWGEASIATAMTGPCRVSTASAWQARTASATASAEG